ncbi:MAG: hypothetical protein LBC85_02460 [Fibromonadaceae bacterium]|nr:hypothetical protein [Fibromonadaceae bacterium]
MKKQKNLKLELQIRNSATEFLIFVNQAGKESIEVRLHNSSVWLPQKLIAVLFAFFCREIKERNLIGRSLCCGEGWLLLEDDVSIDDEEDPVSASDDDDGAVSADEGESPYHNIVILFPVF